MPRASGPWPPFSEPLSLTAIVLLTKSWKQRESLDVNLVFAIQLLRGASPFAILASVFLSSVQLACLNSNGAVSMGTLIRIKAKVTTTAHRGYNSQKRFIT